MIKQATKGGVRERFVVMCQKCDSIWRVEDKTISHTKGCENYNVK